MTDLHSISLWDVSWLAVPDARPSDLVTALDLSDPVPLTWRQGLAAVCGDSWDFEADLGVHLSRVFLPPPLRGWQLVVSGLFGGQEGDERLEEVARICCDLSRRYGRAYAFTAQGRMDFYAWILAENGTVWRHFVWDGGEVFNTGRPVAAEQAGASDSSSGTMQTAEPSEALVAAVASEVSLDPLNLGIVDGDDALGLLATTAWGREHGVPPRSIA